LPHVGEIAPHRMEQTVSAREIRGGCGANVLRGRLKPKLLVRTSTGVAEATERENSGLQRESPVFHRPARRSRGLRRHRAVQSTWRIAHRRGDAERKHKRRRTGPIASRWPRSDHGLPARWTVAHDSRRRVRGIVSRFRQDVHVTGPLLNRARDLVISVHEPPIIRTAARTSLSSYCFLVRRINCSLSSLISPDGGS